MSLFGDFPDDPPASRTKSSLFDDDRPAAAARSTSNLFADDDVDAHGSPWAMPTPKKAGRAQLIKTLLPSGEVPDTYVDIFDQLAKEDSAAGGKISANGVKRVIRESGVNQDTAEKIEGFVLQDGEEGVGRGEINVLLAMVGLAQEGDEVSLDGVDERRRNLPVPNLGLLTSLKTTKTEEHAPSKESVPVSTKPLPQPTEPAPASTPPHTNTRKPSFGLEADPWNSPDLHRGHNHINQNGSSPHPNGSSTTASLPQRTTSAFNTSSNQQDSTSERRTSARPPSAGEAGWGAYTGSSTDSFRDSSLGRGGGFPGGDPPGSNDPTDQGRPIVSAPRPVAPGVEEVVTITSISEKEGMMFFQHRNYEVTSARRNSKVIRRYSDFVWLLDCLHKRYPIRILPLLPPKRVAINGNYLAADATFVEKRRRGLGRFANALVHHPVLSQEQLVIMFLTVPTELSVWRKQANLSVQEEFSGKPLPPGLEDSLSTNLQELFDKVRSGVRRSAELYINLCVRLERLVKRNEGLASENYGFSRGLEALTEASSDTYAVDTNDIPMLNEGLNAAAKHLSSSQALLEDEARAWDEGVLEDMKKQRDLLVSVRDMFDRRDRYDKDNIPQLERRIEANERKLGVLRERTEGVKPGEIEKVEDSIHRDKQSIVAQHARGVFIKECIRDEVIYFQHSQYLVSRLQQDWAQERVKYAELQADNWRALADEVEGMPLNASG